MSNTTLPPALAGQVEPSVGRLDGERAVATVTECEACFTPDVCQLRGTCDHYRAEMLRVSASHKCPPTPVESAVGRLDRERADFEAWAAKQWGKEAWRHMSGTSGEWEAFRAGAKAGDRMAWHNDRADKLREALREIADLRSLTATPEQFCRHLQRIACRALTDDAMAEPETPNVLSATR